MGGEALNIVDHKVWAGIPVLMLYGVAQTKTLKPTPMKTTTKTV